jgi:hypothetical protein
VLRLGEVDVDVTVRLLKGEVRKGVRPDFENVAAWIISPIKRLVRLASRQLPESLVVALLSVVAFVAVP